MTHTVTCKLNKDARQHPNQSGVTFFVSLGEKNYNFKTKQSEYTNYEAAIFAKGNQVQFYSDSLVAGAVVTVSGTGLILEMPDNPSYQPRLHIQDAKLRFALNPNQGQQYQQAPQQQIRAQAPPMDFPDDMDIPF